MVGNHKKIKLMLRLITATSIKFRTNWSIGLQEKLQNYQNQVSG
jgi:hypothetical protein